MDKTTLGISVIVGSLVALMTFGIMSCEYNLSSHLEYFIMSVVGITTGFISYQYLKVRTKKNGQDSPP